jgi:MFS family permease
VSVQLRIRELRAPLSVPSFRSLWWAQLASELGDAVGRIALAVLVTERSGSPVAVGAVLAISVVPYLGLGQWLTAWCERFPRRRVLVVADIVRAACYLLMAADIPLWARFALLFVASSASPPFESVRNALIPATLPEERVTDGVAVMVLTNESTRLVGLVVGGIGATLASPAAALAVNALTFVVSAFLIARLPADEPADEVRSTVRVADGWRAVRHDALLRRIAWMSPAFVAFGAVPEALVVPYAEEVLDRSGSVAGALAASVSASILLIAPLVQRRDGHRALVRQASLVALAGAAVSAGAFALPASDGLALVAFAAVGPVFVSRINLGSAMLLRLPDHLRASTFSLVDGLISVGQVVAGLAGGALAAWVGVQPAFVVAMALTAASAALAYVLPLRAHAAVRSAARG